MSAQVIPYDLYGDLIGTPWVRGGRNPEEGLDCYGLVIEMYRRLGKEVPDFKSPGDLEAAEDVIKRESIRWRRTEMRPGCALLFRVEGYTAHTGFLIDTNKMIHAQDPMGVVVVNRNLWPPLVASYDYE